MSTVNGKVSSKYIHCLNREMVKKNVLKKENNVPGMARAGQDRTIKLKLLLSEMIFKELNIT